MIDLNDLQKPSVAVLVTGAAATAGFVVGFLFGRNPEAAQGLVRAAASGFTRLQVAAAEAWENLGDAWADARAEAQRDIETERFAESSAEEPPEASNGSATIAVATRATAATADPRRRTRGPGKKAKKAAKPARRTVARRARRKSATEIAT